MPRYCLALRAAFACGPKRPTFGELSESSMVDGIRSVLAEGFDATLMFLFTSSIAAAFDEGAVFSSGLASDPMIPSATRIPNTIKQPVLRPFCLFGTDEPMRLDEGSASKE